MKIVFNRQSILSVIAPLMSTATGKATNPAMGGILIEAKHPDTCILTTFDGEKGMRTTVESKVTEEGFYIVNAQKFMQIMRVMNGEEVTFSVDSRLSAQFVCGKSTHRMNALEGASFPELPILESNRGFCVGEGIFRKMLGKIMHAMAVNNQRPVLNGCYVAVENGTLLTVSCDGCKIAKCSLRTELVNRNEDGSDLRFRFILPIKTVNELYKLLSDDEAKEMSIHMARKHIVFYIGDLIFFSLLVDGEYIDYDRIIIRQHKIYTTVDKEELVSALERAALITEERVAETGRSNVKLTLESGVLKITASSTAGSTYDEVEVGHEGGDLTISFSNRFLIDSIRACDSDTVRIALSSPLTSINIEPADGKDENAEDIFMLLPVRTKE